MNSTILSKAENHVKELFEKHLPKDRRFHNYQHTLMVVKGVQEISDHLKLSNKNKEIVELAAWFHDAGHIIRYAGHEEESKNLAQVFLELAGYSKRKISKVIETIDGTNMPQQPHNRLQKILCDADLFHLSQPEYLDLSNRLREEWGAALHKEYSDGEWRKENIRFLKNHHYYTGYGKKVLQKRKESNIKNLENND